MAARTRDLSQIRRRNRGVRIEMRLDGVDAVAICTNRRLPITTLDGSPVNALTVLLFDSGVALGASGGDIEPEYR